MGIVTGPFSSATNVPDPMRPSAVVPWYWTLESGLSPRDALRLYDTRVEERMSNPGQREADEWSGPDGLTQYRRLSDVCVFAMSVFGSRTDVAVIAGVALPDVRR